MKNIVFISAGRTFYYIDNDYNLYSTFDSNINNKEILLEVFAHKDKNFKMYNDDLLLKKDISSIEEAYKIINSYIENEIFK